MTQPNSTSSVPLAATQARTDIAQLFCILILAVVVVATFALQDKIVGFEGGYSDYEPNHHGWVTAHTLAIISNATPQNYFVGYALVAITDQGELHYDYFDRYPFFFSAIMNRILSLAPTLADKILLAKQVMNFIFLATVILAFLLIDKLINDKILAVAAALLSFSNLYLLWYKDMVHFDQPALFGFLLLIYAIAFYKLDRTKRFLYVATFVAIALGRGYASYSIFMVWLAVEAFLILKTRGLSLIEKIKQLIRHPSFYLFVVAIVWGGILLGYNILIEARTRHVTILQTSIIQSARSRLSLNPEFNVEKEGIINWPDFLESQIDRVVRWAFPFRSINKGLFVSSLILIGMFVVMGLMLQKAGTEKRTIYWLLALSGFGWLIPLRNLSAFHDYTAMYYIGIPLAFFAAVFVLVKIPRNVTYFIVVATLIIYVTALVQVKHWHEEREGDVSAYTYDFMRIREQIDGTGKRVKVVAGIPYGPFPLGFYLHGQYLSSKNTAQYLIAGNPEYMPNNLTPENQVIFLFRK
jgi:hypothetical protein